ncbi:MAG TPA: hypothetical protein VLI65_09415, partial [Pyrinomonadaceae bacterium]|nr:hypothetical protein [Pyrinomonadaceae bacterium]
MKSKSLANGLLFIPPPSSLILRKPVATAPGSDSEPFDFAGGNGHGLAIWFSDTKGTVWSEALGGAGDGFVCEAD